MKNTALITGASSGIGKALSHIHAENGGDLVVVARREDKLNDLKSSLEESHSVRVRVIAMDLGDAASPRAIFDMVKAEGIEIDYLINNAGFGGHGQFHERDWQQDLAMIQLNVVCLTELCRLFLPDFVKRNKGRILNVSSTASLPPGGPFQSVYFATKHYVTALSYGIASELEGSGVTVTALLPGATESEFAQTSGMDKTDLFSKTASARSVAEDGYRAMLDGKLDVVSGLTASQKLIMAAMPFMPKKLVLSQVRQMQESGG
ncbi:MAG: SDR family oxidoreductase [Verrucomicrobiota bacterium]